MRKIVGICLLSIFYICAVNESISFARALVSVGYGKTRQIAIDRAIKNAVEKAIGLYITSSSKVYNGRLIYENITSNTYGYVKNYRIINISHNKITKIYIAKLYVVVDDKKLKNSIREFMVNPVVQKTFQETKFHYKRIILKYEKLTSSIFTFSPYIIHNIMTSIEDRLSKYGFRVFVLSKRGSNANLYNVGDVCVYVNIDVEKNLLAIDDNYCVVRFVLSLRAVDTSTGEIIAISNKTKKIIVTCNKYKPAYIIPRVAKIVVSNCVDDLVKKIVERFSGNHIRWLLIVFKEASNQQQYKIESVIENMGFRFRIFRQNNTFLEMELFDDIDTTSLVRILSQELKKRSLPFVPVEVMGNKIVFKKLQKRREEIQ